MPKRSRLSRGNAKPRARRMPSIRDMILVDAGVGTVHTVDGEYVWHDNEELIAKFSAKGEVGDWSIEVIENNTAYPDSKLGKMVADKLDIDPDIFKGE